MTKSNWFFGVVAIGLQALSGCAAPADGAAGSPDEAEVQVALTVVPSGVACVRVTVTSGSTTVTPPLVSVSPGMSSATLNLGQLAAGASTFNGTAFNVACASVVGSTVANWIAAPVTTTLVTGLMNQVSLTFLPNNTVGVSANFIAAPTQISVGPTTSRVRLSDGTVREWGQGVRFGIFLMPNQVPGLTDAVQVATGGPAVGCARRANGTLACWGGGDMLGVPMGNNITDVPVNVALPNSPLVVTQVSLGSNHACAVQFEFAYCWGDNSQGQFGNGTTNSNGTPAQTFNSAAISNVFAGVLNTCFTLSDGTVACTGSNAGGQLGNGTTTSSLTPIVVSGLVDVVDVAVGATHVCALRGDGTVRCWGTNNFGQLGDGTTTQRLTPVQVSGLTDAVHIVAGANHTCALRQTGAVSCWGKGSAMGDGIGNNRTVPADVAGLSGVVAVDAHLGAHTCVIAGDRSVKCWGDNSFGQIDFSVIFAAKPTTIVLQ